MGETTLVVVSGIVSVASCLVRAATRIVLIRMALKGTEAHERAEILRALGGCLHPWAKRSERQG